MTSCSNTCSRRRLKEFLNCHSEKYEYHNAVKQVVGFVLFLYIYFIHTDTACYILRQVSPHLQVCVPLTNTKHQMAENLVYRYQT